MAPATLEGHGVRLEPLDFPHEPDLRVAAADGDLWRLNYTPTPPPDGVRAFIEAAGQERAQGTRFAFAVRELGSNRVVGSTSYHDLVPAVPRVEIGCTWYAASWQRTFLNTACKWLLLEHAFGPLRCAVVGWRTDSFNTRSQRAIERLGAKKDGVIRGARLRKDGSIRDTVMYSVTAEEYATTVRAHMQSLLARLL